MAHTCKVALCLILMTYHFGLLEASVHVSATGLTSFPHNIPLGSTSITVSDCLISFVDYFESFLSLTTLSLSRNQINQFPDLGNVSTTLTTLYLYENQLVTISPSSLLDQLVKLEMLFLQDNPLIAIPDVSGPGNTLIVLNMGNTAITSLPTLTNLGKSLLNLLLLSNSLIKTVTADEINSLPTLDVLNLNSVIFDDFPNLCRVNTAVRPSLRLRLVLANNQFACNQDMVWAKLASTIANITWIGGAPTCDMPNVINVDVGTSSINTLVQRDNDIYFERITDLAGFYCYPTILSVTNGVETLSACGVLCLKNSDCVLLAYDGGQCVQAAATPGSESAFRQYAKWYVITAKMWKVAI